MVHFYFYLVFVKNSAHQPLLFRSLPNQPPCQLTYLFEAGDDMKSIAGGIYDPEKKTRALADSETLKKYAKAADIPVSRQDGEAFLTAANKMDELFEDFFEQLRDVPDEL
jgi:hypothetical protein